MSETNKASDPKQRELVAFRIGAQEFCIDVMAVREIRGWAPITPLPHSPAYVRGLINLRGTVLPIVDVGARLGLPDSCNLAALKMDLEKIAADLLVDISFAEISRDV